VSRRRLTRCKNRATFRPVRRMCGGAAGIFPSCWYTRPIKLHCCLWTRRGYFGAKSLRRAHGGRDWPPRAAAPPPLTAAPYQPPPATRCLSTAVAAQIGRINRTRRVAATFNHPLARALPASLSLSHSLTHLCSVDPVAPRTRRSHTAARDSHASAPGRLGRPRPPDAASKHLSKVSFF
jgi:hypothetical protein